MIGVLIGLLLLLGRGDGTFQEAQSYATGAGPSFVVIGDFNGDGILDLAVANYDDGTVSGLLGKGDGTFQATQNSGAGGYARQLGEVTPCHRGPQSRKAKQAKGTRRVTVPSGKNKSATSTSLSPSSAT